MLKILQARLQQYMSYEIPDVQAGFFHDPVDVGNLISGSSAFPNPAWTSGISQFMYCWSLAWKILIITLLAYEMTAIVR